MKILLIGYGKMGQTLAALAPAHGHEVAGIVDQHASTQRIEDFTPAQVDGRDVSSEWILRFGFQKTATKVLPVRAAP